MIEVDEGKAIQFLVDWADCVGLPDELVYLENAICLFGVDVVQKAIEQMNAERGFYMRYKINEDGKTIKYAS